MAGRGVCFAFVVGFGVVVWLGVATWGAGGIVFCEDAGIAVSAPTVIEVSRTIKMQHMIRAA
jgi:hypothetical protein